MKITSLDLFDLYGDGTLVMLTHTDVCTDDLQYCWYIKRNKMTVYKGVYQRNPYLSFQLDSMGTYVVKAFVKNSKGEKAVFEQTFRPTKKTSPQLAQAVVEGKITMTPVAERISAGFWQFTVKESFEENAKFAWYIYHAGDKEPIVRTPYANQASYVHKFEQSGTYRAKLFVIQNEEKHSQFSETFSVNV